MPCKFRLPSLRRHKPSARGVVTLNGGDHYLGPWPPGCKEAPPETRDAYDRLVAEWLANGRRLPPTETTSGPNLSVNQVILAFWSHAQQHYRKSDGQSTTELGEYRVALSFLRRLYGSLPAAEFSPLKLKAVRQTMINAGLSRGVINKRITRIVHMYKWLVAEELVPETVYRALRAVPGLQKGRSEAHEAEPVRPVAEEIVQATLPYVLPPIKAMAELQFLSGMRPGEACIMRGCDLDMSGPIWLYQPESHKTQHQGRLRVIPLGPRAQEVIKPFLRLDTQGYLFNPREALEVRRAARRAARKSKVQPSQVDRRKEKPKRRPNERYSTTAYRHAIAKGVEKANRVQACESCKKLKPETRCKACKAVAIPHWHPNQLRHTRATEIRRKYGLEAAQVTLGHSQANVTQVYAERDRTLAMKVAAEIG